MKNKIALNLGIGLLGLLTVGTAHAIPITWSLDVTFNTGHTAAGSYVFDADINRFVSFDITSSSGNHYGFINQRSPGHAGLISTVASAGLQSGTAQMFIQLATEMTNAGGTIDVLPGFIWSGGSGFSWEGICTSANCATSGAYRDVAFGQVSTLPTVGIAAPGTLPLIAFGMAGLGFVVRKRRSGLATA